MSDSNEKHKWYWDDARLRQLLTWITGKISGSIPTMTEFTKEEIEALWSAQPEPTVSNYISGVVSGDTSTFTLKVNGKDVVVEVSDDGAWRYDIPTDTTLTNFNRMFYNKSNLTSVDLSHVDVSSVTNMAYMFYNCENLTTVTFSDDISTKNVTSTVYMFNGCKNITSIDLSNFYSTRLVETFYMFNNCENLTTINFGEHFTISNVTDISNMFANCFSLTALDLRYFNTSNMEYNLEEFHAEFFGVPETSPITYCSSKWNPNIITENSRLNWVDLDA